MQLFAVMITEMYVHSIMKINHHFIKLHPFFKAYQLNNSLDSVEVAEPKRSHWDMLASSLPCLLLAHPCPCLPGSAAPHSSCSRPCAPPASLLSLFHTLGILLPCSHIPAETCCSQHLKPLKSLTTPNISWCCQLNIYPG